MTEEVVCDSPKKLIAVDEIVRRNRGGKPNRDIEGAWDILYNLTIHNLISLTEKPSGC
jgi:hypothetical protein